MRNMFLSSNLRQKTCVGRGKLPVLTFNEPGTCFKTFESMFLVSERFGFVSELPSGDVLLLASCFEP